MNNNLFRINARVYVAGISMPYTAITITQSFNALPQCTVALPPERRLFGLGRNDRIPIQVFIEETFVGNQDQYILMFEGEITSTGYSNTSLRREFTITATSNLAFLQDVNFELITNLDEYARSTKPGAEFGSLHVQGHPSFAMPMSLFTHGLVPDFKNANGIRYPVEFIRNIAKYLAGDFEFAADTPLAEFYKRYSKELLRFSDRIASVPYFDDGQASWSQGEGARGFPILSGVQAQAVMSKISNMINSGPQHGSVYDFTNYFVSQMEYELAFFASPTFSQRDGTDGQPPTYGPNSVCLKPMFYDAIPPACNLITRCALDRASMREQVYQVPTRVRTRDSSGIMEMLTQGDNSVLKEWSLLDYYPSSHSLAAARNANSPQHLIQEEPLLATEEFTGPYIADAHAPSWLSFVNPKLYLNGNEQVIGDQMRRHMYMLKRYEQRTLSAGSAFNPYLTPGFPAVLYDSLAESGDPGFTFIGQLTALTHSITKTSASTDIGISFVRMLDESEELAEPNDNGMPGRGPLTNSMSIISEEITHQLLPMSQIYQSLIGCTAVTREYAASLGGAEEQDNPRAMYERCRREITTLEEYASFIGATIEEDGRLLTGSTYLSTRFEPEFLGVLDEISLGDKEQKIYDN